MSGLVRCFPRCRQSYQVFRDIYDVDLTRVWHGHELYISCVSHLGECSGGESGLTAESPGDLGLPV